ncbi:MAG: SH3 domain-containing protein [Proteobacteria bacterium]|nr:SH3 domain-containing protein [Pseudomonadota bacterium]
MSRAGKAIPRFLRLIVVLGAVALLFGCAESPLDGLFKKGGSGQAPGKDQSTGGAGALQQRSSVTAHRLAVRMGPSVKYGVINALKKGETVEVLERKGSWIRVRSERVDDGWVYGAYLTGFEGTIARPERQTKKAASGGGADKNEPDLVTEEGALGSENELDKIMK